MLNTAYYNQLIKKSGLPHEFIAYRLKLSADKYNQKAAGVVCFGADEMAIIKDLFNLSAAEATKLFFTSPFKAYCIENGITGADLAQLLGVSRSTAYRYMKSSSRLKVSQVVKICKAFNISADSYF